MRTSTGNGSYWQRTTSRRRAVAGAAALGIGAAALAACGGGNDSGGDSGSGESAGLLTRNADTTSQAVKGGIWQSLIQKDIADLDPTSAPAVDAQSNAAFVYSRLMKFKAGVGEPSAGVLEPDLAESWEVLDGGLRLIFHIRQDAGTDQRAPTNGRKMDANDVVFSYDRFSRLNAQGIDLARSRAPDAPVDKLEAPDPRTVVVRLADPYAAIMPLLGSGRHLWVIPREADKDFNPSKESHGSGPWILSQYQTSSHLEYRRNPNWYSAKDRPFLDGIDQTILGEAAQVSAQFRTGNLWTAAIRQETMIPTKRDLPNVVLQQNPEFTTSLAHIMFGFKAGSPFLDERVRQAVSMSQDREIYTDTFFNTKGFHDDGVDLEVRWLSHLPPGWEGLWLNPEGKDLGDSAKYWQYDPAAAKQLLSAAGFPNGLDTTWSYVSNNYGVDWPNRNEVIANMAQEFGIKTNRNPVDYAASYIPDYYRGRGNFDGISTSTGGARPDPGLWLYAHYHSTGSVGHFTLGNKSLDPEFDRLLAAQMKEYDPERRKTQIKDIQRYAAKLMPVVPIGGYTGGLQISWPWFANYGVIRTWPSTGVGTEVNVHYWYDKSKQT